MRYVRGMVVCMLLAASGCGGQEKSDDRQSPTLDAESQSASQSSTSRSSTLGRMGEVPSLAWQATDIVGSKLHLVSEPDEITFYRFDADGTVAGNVYDLGMQEMYWKIESGRLVICDDDDFLKPHSSLRLHAWDGEKAMVYNEILKREEEYIRTEPKPLDVELLLGGGSERPDDKVSD